MSNIQRYYRGIRRDMYETHPDRNLVSGREAVIIRSTQTHIVTNQGQSKVRISRVRNAIRLLGNFTEVIPDSQIDEFLEKESEVIGAPIVCVQS